MSDRLDELEVLTAILDAGSLAAAARRLRRSPPAVTRILSTVEERIGTRLVERTTRRLAPTEAGRLLADRARNLLAAYADMLSATADTRAMVPRGLLRVTAPVVFGRRHVAPIVASFLDACPQVQVELVLADRNLDLVEGTIDVAVRIGTLAETRLVARRVGQVRRVLVASPAYLERRGCPRRPADLARHDIVYSSAVHPYMEWRFAAPRGRDQTVRLAPRLAVNDVEAMLIAVRDGRGIGRPLSYQVADELTSGALVRIMSKFEPAPLPVHLVVPTARFMPLRVRAFLDHAAAALTRLPVIQDRSGGDGARGKSRHLASGRSR